jgi:DNA-binding LacI/PurR family transcriptional regulator
VPEIAQRFGGYCAALSEAGLSVDANLTVSSGFDTEHGLQATTALIDSGVRFDAIFAASDIIAISAIRALEAIGCQVPQDVSVVGFDDIQLAAYSNPPLTTVRQDVGMGARLLVRAISDAIAGRPISPVEMPAELVIRHSSGPAKALH